MVELPLLLGTDQLRGIWLAPTVADRSVGTLGTVVTLI